MVSIHDLGVDVVRGNAIPFQVQLLSNKFLYFKNRGAKMLFIFPDAILGIYGDAMLIRFSLCEN